MAQVDRIIIRFDIVGGKEAQIMLSQISKLLIGISPAAAKGKGGITAFARATGTGAIAMNKFGQSIDNNIIKISEFAVVIFALVGAYNILVKPIIEVNKNMKIVESVSHATSRELKALKEEAIRLGTIFPGGAAKATEALVAIGQAGYNTRESMQLMEPVFKLATIGQVDYAESVELTIATLNAFSKPVSEASQVIDTLAASISHTLTTFDTFKVALPALASLSADLGIEFEEVVALLGYLRDRGIPASRTATSLKNVFTEFTKETAGLSEALEGTGLKVEDFDIKARGLRAVIESVANSSLDAGQKIDLLGLRGIYAGSIIDTEVTAYLWEMVEALKEAGESSYQTGIILESTTSKWAQFAGEIQRSLEETFEPFLEKIDKLIDNLRAFTRALRTIPEPIKWIIRNLIILIASLTTLSLMIKLNILLFYNFIWQKGLYAAVPVIANVIKRIRDLNVVMGVYRAGIIGAATATRGFLLALGPIAWTILGIGVAVGVVSLGMAGYKKSLRGMKDEYGDLERAARTEAEELRALSGRLKDAADKFKELKEKGEDTIEPMIEIKTVMLDIIEKFPELGRKIGTFDSMADKVGAVTVQLSSMDDELQDILDKLEEIAAKEFFKMATEMMEKTSLWKEGKDAGARRGMYYTPGFVPTGVVRKYFEEDLRKGGMQASDKLLMKRMTGTLTDEFVQGLEDAVNAAPLKTKEEEIAQKFVSLMWLRLGEQELSALLAKKGEEPEPKPPPGGDGKAAKYTIPGLIEFNQELSRIRAEQSLAISELTLQMMEAGKDELFINKAVNDLKLEQLQREKDIYAAYLNVLQLEKQRLEGLKQTEDITKAIEKVNDNIIKIQVNQIGLQAKGNDLLIEEQKIYDEFIQKGMKFFKKKMEDGLEWLELLKEALATTARMVEAEKELDAIRRLGVMRGETNQEILEQQLQFVDSQIEEMIRLLDNIEVIFGSLGNIVVSVLKKIGAGALRGLTELREDIARDIETIKEKEAKEEIYKSTKESVESAIVDALLSGNVKDAIQTFADLIKQAVAEKLAAQIVDKMSSFVNAFSVYQGGGVKSRGAGRTAGQHQDVTSMAMAGSGAAGATAGGAAATLGWIGVGLMAASFLGNMFGGKNKIDEMDTKLNYIIRGGGYQLPSSFLLPEDEGEFSARRRGKDGFNVKFPKRSLDVNITHKFEWEPSELAKAVGSSMSVGAMSSVKQYSLIGGE